MVLGNLNNNTPSGHAWVVVRRYDQQWYILESTTPPNINPWTLMENAMDRYTPTVTFSDRVLNCGDKNICFSLS